ncbi:MAG: FmdE family protein [Nitrospirota bacterium]|nr:FmdE family protein [Nitrospirota bacterium]
MSHQFDDDLRETIQFHGHLCPGLALGYRVAKAALRELDAERPGDEELVAVVENDSCAVDAIQFITGCTFGKGNLVFRDYGKHVYTFHNRRTGAAVRISEDYQGFRNDPRYRELRKRMDTGENVSREMQAFKMEKASAILSAEEAELMRITAVTAPPPSEARIRQSVLCSICGERFMETRGRELQGRIICIPCSEKG